MLFNFSLKLLIAFLIFGGIDIFCCVCSLPMSTTFYTTPSHSKHLYNKKRKTTAIPDTLNEQDDIIDIAANSRPSFRWIVLMIICFSMFSYSYCYDNPVALQSQLQSRYNLSNIEYNLLYSAYTFPNMILPFFSGIFADIFSADLMIIIFFLFIVIGQGIFIIGCGISIYYIMFIGRFLFGIGAESFSLVITPLIYEYFKNKELSFALGLLLSLSRLGSSTNDYTTFLIYDKTNDNIVISLLIGLFILIISLIFIIILLIQRYSVFYVIKKSKESLLIGNKIKTRHTATTYYDSLPQHSINSVSHDVIYNNPLNMTHSIDIIQNKKIEKYRENKAVSYDYHERRNNHSLSYKELNKNKEKEIKKEIKKEPESESESKFKLKDLKQFDGVYWLLVINCGLIYGIVLSFMNIGSDYLQTHYGYNHKLGNTLLMIPYIVGAILTPIFGYISDRIGRRGYLLLISTIMLIITHYLFTWIYSKYDIYFAIIGMSCMGISYSIFCAVIWPSFALVIPERLIGTGYGIPVVFYNSILSIFYLLVGVLTNIGVATSKNDPNYYENVEIFLFSLSIFTTLTVILLIIIDNKNGSRLNMPTITPS